jgi:hypothetical protein
VDCDDTSGMRPLLDQLAVDVVAHSVLAEVTALAEQADTLTDGELRARLLGCWARLSQVCRRGAAPPAVSESPAGYRRDHRRSRYPAGSTIHHARAGERDRAVSPTARPPTERWLDVHGTPITVGARVEQTSVDIELGALRSRLGTQGDVLRCSATRLVVRFEGETRLARIRPPLLRVVVDW